MEVSREMARAELARRGKLPGSKKPTTLRDRAETLLTYGPTAAAGGAKRGVIDKALNSLAPDIYQATGNIVGGAVGGPGGSAYGGAVGRGFYEAYRQLVSGEGMDVSGVLSETQRGALGEIFGLGTAKAIEKFIPMAKKSAIRIVESIIKAKGKLAEKGSEIAETALKEGLSGSKYAMLQKTYKNLRQATHNVNQIIAKYGSRKITAEKAIGYLENLENQYIRNADSKSAEYVKNLRDDFVKNQNLQEPKFSESETGQFVMRGSSRVSTSTKPVMQNKRRIPGAARREFLKPGQTKRIGTYFDPSTNQEIPTRAQNIIPGRRIVTPKTFVDDAEDIVALHRPGKGETYIYPERSRQILPEVRGVSRKEKTLVGYEPRRIPLQEAQDLKRGQYDLLESKRVEGGYGSEVLSPEIKSRQAYARGLKESIEEAVPEEMTSKENSRIGKLLNLSEALEDRILVADRQNLLGLTDVILGGASFSDPRNLSILAAKRALGTDTAKNFMAGPLYKASELRKVQSFLEDRRSGAAARALISRLLYSDESE